MNRVEVFEKDIDLLIKDLDIIKREKERIGRRNVLYLELKNVSIEINYTEIITNIIQVDAQCYDDNTTYTEYSLISDNNKIHKKRFIQFLQGIKKATII